MKGSSAVKLIVAVITALLFIFIGASLFDAIFNFLISNVASSIANEQQIDGNLGKIIRGAKVIMILILVFLAIILVIEVFS